MQLLTQSPSRAPNVTQGTRIACLISSTSILGKATHNLEKAAWCLATEATAKFTAQQSCDSILCKKQEVFLRPWTFLVCVRELCLAEQGEAGNGVGDVPSADVQLIWKNRLCLPDSCLTTDQTGQRGQNPPSQQGSSMSESPLSLFKVNCAKNEPKEP